LIDLGGRAKFDHGTLIYEGVTLQRGGKIDLVSIFRKNIGE
jgi:hypothetical protein